MTRPDPRWFPKQIFLGHIALQNVVCVEYNGLIISFYGIVKILQETFGLFNLVHWILDLFAFAVWAATGAGETLPIFKNKAAVRTS